MEHASATPHRTPFAGDWYPGRPAELAALLDSLFDRSLERTGPSLLPRPLALVVPHAGLAYSGTVAASAYRHLQEARPERIFLLGFSHHVRLAPGAPGVSIPDIPAYETPVGTIPIDCTAARELASDAHFAIVPESQVCDHSVEIQLPLLRKAIPGVPVVPLYVGPLDNDQRSAAAQRLARSLRLGDLLLASSDFTHYGRAFGYQPFPPGRDFHQRLFRLDSEVIEAAGSLDPVLFRETLDQLSSTVCGRDPIALLLETLGVLAGEDVFQQTFDYQTSAEITGDSQHSVSYAALGYFRPDAFFLDADAQRALLESARATLQNLRDTGVRRPVPADPACPALHRRTALFVSLHYGSQLFGCVGTRRASQPIATAVAELTLSAAMEDPRFSRLRPIPDDLDIEISVLTPMRRIRDWQSFRIGRDGACLDYGSRSGLLLPQVAGRGFRTPDRFLEALCQKAGLAPAAYRDPQARLSIFRAQRLGAANLN
jgi:MEMO1 family protein